MHAYTVDQLKKNRASVLVFGGTEADRRAFALAAAQHFREEGALVEARDAAALDKALGHDKGVVYVPDACALPPATQREVVRLLREREERPKLVLGLPMQPAAALDKGLLRDDLHYWLRTAVVDVKARATRR